MRKIAACTVAITALACAGSPRAHHSISMFDVSTPIWLKGTVVRYEPISPHAMIELAVTGEDGRVQRWAIEGPFPGRLNRILSLNRMGVDEDFLKIGDVIEACGFPSKGAHDPSRRFVHGHVFVMPDGRMQSWGPYGRIHNCVRPSDQTRSWIDFLDSDPLAREFWCASRALVKVGSIAPRAFVDKINGSMANPCN